MDKLPITADYQHGVDMARLVACRVLRSLNVSDDVFCSVALAMQEVREKRPLYGAQPDSTEAEGEIFQKQVEARFAA